MLRCCLVERLDIDAVAVNPPGLRVGNALPFAALPGQAHAGVSHTAHAAGPQLTPRVDTSCQSRTHFDATNNPEDRPAR